jgi:hypothetical protein
MNSKQYDDANHAFSVAIKIYIPIRDAYREGKISDAEFITAQKAYYAAEALYDAAYALEANHNE